MVIISLVRAESYLDLECSYLQLLCETTYVPHSIQSIEKKISVVCQNINKNNCQSHLPAPPHKNNSHCMTSCRACGCGCLSIVYFLYVIALFEIVSLNIFGLNQLILIMPLSTHQQHQISKYKIPKNVINCLCVSSLSSKFATIVLFASIASCAFILVSFVSYALENIQAYLNYEMGSFFANYSTLLINSIKKIPQRKTCKNIRVRCKI